ncbi:hypothetical protein D3C84_544700 [compost metagenome]
MHGLGRADAHRARAGTVNILAQHVPARRHATEGLEARLAQDTVLVAALLPVHRAKRHVLVVLLASLAVVVWFHRMDDIDPGFRVVVEQGLNCRAERSIAELLLHLASRHAQIAIERVHLVAAVVGQHVAADRQGVRTQQIVVIWQHDHGGGTEHALFAVAVRQDAVEVRPRHDFTHGLLNGVEPGLDRCELHHVGIWRTELHPGRGRVGHTGVHTGAEGAGGEGRLGVDDLLVTALAAVDVGVVPASRTRADEVAEFLPLRQPVAVSLALQAGVALFELFAQGVGQLTPPTAFSGWCWHCQARQKSRSGWCRFGRTGPGAGGAQHQRQPAPSRCSWSAQRSEQC